MLKKNYIVNISIVTILVLLITSLNYIDNRRLEIKTKKEQEEIIEVNDKNVQDSLVLEETLEIVYDEMTIEQLADKLNRSLRSDLTGTGYIYAKYSLEYGVDPYLAVAITLHETGCGSKCNIKVTECNNVGGQKFRPTCYAGGSYGKYETLELGIEGFIRNIAVNYIQMGLITPEQMQRKYAGSSSWATKVNNYIEKVKSK